MPGLSMTRSPNRTERTSVPTAATTPSTSAPRMWGKVWPCGRPRTTNRSRWLTAAARIATRTSRCPSGTAGSDTSASWTGSRLPVARMTQARIGGLWHERRGHHLLGAGRGDRDRGTPTGRSAPRRNRLDEDLLHVLLHVDH